MAVTTKGDSDAGDTDGCSPPMCLLAAAKQVMLTPNTDEKAALTLRFAELWEGGDLPIGPDTPSEELAAPDLPARPLDLTVVEPGKMKSGTKKSMIHSLIHAESYAIDLSWDIILRFAYSGSEGALLPADFFNDWVQVAKEEAQHYGSWLGRYQSLGYTFGDLPVHDSLWNSASDTYGDILDRLVIVHCVHEARGLDVSEGLLAKLRKSDDEDSIAILKHNVGEEVGHVGRGVKWIKWVCRERGLDATDAFHAVVKEKFTGKLRPPFNVEARDAAGMDREWYEGIAEVRK